jgi:hypothetical protein
LTFNGLRGVISQNIEHFINNAICLYKTNNGKITRIMFLLLICLKIILPVKKVTVMHTFRGESLAAFRCELRLRVQLPPPPDMHFLRVIKLECDSIVQRTVRCRREGESCSQLNDIVTANDGSASARLKVSVEE